MREIQLRRHAWSQRGIGAGSILYADQSTLFARRKWRRGAGRRLARSYKEDGRFTPPDEPDRGPAKAWAYPVVANGRLYIRDVKMLWCYEVKADGEK